ncbi:hypothetical protein PIB30_010275 [Stylosanthes scabra]|uniref:Uncharacterized protein n=1 Tax=Stylosanthes scabra TaxID=79078 RepID=A0ABU6T7L4_9FABA|nr:hypothetical protein [Stylosanthes scabra]
MVLVVFLDQAHSRRENQIWNVSNAFKDSKIVVVSELLENRSNNTTFVINGSAHITNHAVATIHAFSSSHHHGSHQLQRRMRRLLHDHPQQPPQQQDLGAEKNASAATTARRTSMRSTRSVKPPSTRSLRPPLQGLPLAFCQCRRSTCRHPPPLRRLRLLHLLTATVTASSSSCVSGRGGNW